MRILSVVGARPNFMKIAPLARVLRATPGVEHILVHSGQHYDAQLSESFFRDLDIPEPDINLEVGSASHAVQTAEIMKRIEPVLVDKRPNLLVVVGDVNSTIAAALTAAKLGIRIAHVEAGLRSFDRTMPEEINRLLTDAISDYLFVTEESGVRNLRNEGVPEERIFLVGNVMIDTLLQHREKAAQTGTLQRMGLADGSGKVRPYALLTLHRPSNVDDAQRLRSLLETLTQIGRELPILFPVHPRTQERIARMGLEGFFTRFDNTVPATGLLTMAPLGYLEFLSLMDRARLVLTDSGGTQEETTVLGVPCLTLRENTERPVTIECGSNQLVGLDPARILSAAQLVLRAEGRRTTRPPLWDGQAASRIVEVLVRDLGRA